MKVSRVLIAAALVSACSSEPAVERQPTPTPAPVEPAPATTPDTTGTTGDAVAPEPATPAPRRAPRAAARQTDPRVVQTARADAREAEKGAVTQAAAAAGVNTDAAVLADFKTRVDKYVAIHKDAAKGAAKPKETENPAEIVATQEALATRIRAARAGAKQGDIFTAEIRTKFRRLLAPELKGEDGRDAKAVMKEDAPSAASIPFKVNAKYPEGAPLPTVPSNLLLNLPTLPEPLEYRIIGKHLVLLDTGAGIIVDYLPNAIA